MTTSTTKTEAAQTASEILGTQTTQVVTTKKPRAARKTVTKKVAEKSSSPAKTKVKKSTFLGKIANVGRGVKNVFVGMGLAFLGNLPVFLDPVGFLFFNSHRIALGLIHLLMPIVIAGAAIWQNQEMMGKITNFSFESVILCCSLYAFGTFAWMLAWLFARSIGFGIGYVFKQFAQTGERKGNVSADKI